MSTIILMALYVWICMFMECGHVWACMYLHYSSLVVLRTSLSASRPETQLNSNVAPRTKEKAVIFLKGNKMQNLKY